MQEQLIHRGNPGMIGGANPNRSEFGAQNPALRLFGWYISPMHDRATLHRLWYHGANAVLSTVICFEMLSLLVLALALIPFCGLGLLFIYLQCLSARRFVVTDSRFSHYFFGSTLFPRSSKFSIFIPSSHSPSMAGKLKEYMTDPHMLEVILYFCFIKLPAAFILSGITMVILSGVTAILLSPLVFWLDPDYFRDDRYCLFGSKEYDVADGSTVVCGGWAVNSFGETFLAFLAFIPALPLTLHISNFTAKLLCRVTLNFLSIKAPSSPNQSAPTNSHQQQHQIYGNSNISYSNANGPNAVPVHHGGYR